MSYYNLSLGKIAEDDNEDPDMVAQILNEVLAIVAPSNMAISYSVYMVPCYGDDGALIAYKVYSPLSVWIRNRLRPGFMHILKQYLSSGVCTAGSDEEI
jgi:hypothetical protein